MDINIHLEDEGCIEWIKKMQKMYPSNNEFSKHMETLFKIFEHFVSNSKWEFVDETSKKIEERIGEQLRTALADNNSTNQITQQIINQEIQQNIQFQLSEQLIKLEERVSKPISSEFLKLQDTIDQFRGLSKNASSKGKIGEMNIERQLEWYFPECEIEDTRSEAEQADYHFSVDNQTLLLEIKTYSKNVGTKEIDKFIRDLTTKTHIHSGILISTTSGIVKKPKFSYEIIVSENGPKLAVYVPNAIDQASGNCTSVVWAILFTLRVMQFEKQNSKSNGDSGNLADSCEIIRHQMSWLEYMLEQNQTSLLQLEKCYRKSHAALDEWLEQCKKGWKTMDDILKQQIQITKQYLNDGKKELIPLPTGAESVSVSSGSVWKCCGKTYKTEKNYEKHCQTHTAQQTSITNSFKTI